MSPKKRKNATQLFHTNSTIRPKTVRLCFDQKCVYIPCLCRKRPPLLRQNSNIHFLKVNRLIVSTA